MMETKKNGKTDIFRKGLLCAVYNEAAIGAGAMGTIVVGLATGCPHVVDSAAPVAFWASAAALATMFVANRIESFQRRMIPP